MYMENLKRFIDSEQSTTDIFCFQEVGNETIADRENLHDILRTFLEDYTFYSSTTSHYNA